MKFNEGFTLIELMIVMLILAILAFIAFPVFSLARESAWKNSCKANLRIIDGAVLIYKAQNGELPEAAVNSWNNQTGFAGTIVDPDVDFDDLVPYYIKEPIVCPKGGTYTYYRDESITQRYTVCSVPEHN
ncbi:MAG: type II secretion system GspH family protein [Actinobacteria bacterium]|nr:type II secretion system GspH family protein [Actinomycetota bacterium]